MVSDLLFDPTKELGERPPKGQHGGHNRIVPTEGMLAAMVEAVQEGATLVQTAEAMGVSKTLFGLWVVAGREPEMQAAWWEAKRVYGQQLADEVMQQASAPLHDNPKMANAEVQRRRLIVDTSKWLAGKLIPKIYGEKVQVDHEHSGTIQLSPLAQLRQLEAGGPIVDVTPGLPEPTPTPAPATEDDCF